MARITNRPSTLERWLEEENSWDQRHDDREYRPRLGAFRESEESWRLARLERVYGTARALFLLTEQRPLPATIVVSLYDERGHLAVETTSPEWGSFLEPIFGLAWRSENEKFDKVIHLVHDGLN